MNDADQKDGNGNMILNYLKRKSYKFMIILRRYYYLRGCKKVGNNVIVYGKIRVKGHRHISIGNNVRLNEYVYLYASDEMIIGDDVTISSNTTIVNGQYDTTIWKDNCFLKEHISYPIEVGRGTWISSNCIVLPGVKILGVGCIIGAGSVVNRSYQKDYMLIAGNPSREIKSLV